MLAKASKKLVQIITYFLNVKSTRVKTLWTSGKRWFKDIANSQFELHAKVNKEREFWGTLSHLNVMHLEYLQAVKKRQGHSPVSVSISLSILTMFWKNLPADNFASYSFYKILRKSNIPRFFFFLRMASYGYLKFHSASQTFCSRTLVSAFKMISGSNLLQRLSSQYLIMMPWLNIALQIHFLYHVLTLQHTRSLHRGPSQTTPYNNLYSRYDTLSVIFLKASKSNLFFYLFLL